MSRRHDTLRVSELLICTRTISETSTARQLITMASYRNVVDLVRRRERRGDAHFRHTLDAMLESSFFGIGTPSIGEDTVANTNRAPNDLPLNDQVLSTIAIAISPDGELVATTHGDHTIKVFHYHTAKQHRTFRGHPRTPWTVKFHPSDPNIVASGCLGFEVCRFPSLVSREKALSFRTRSSSPLTRPSPSFLCVLHNRIPFLSLPHRTPLPALPHLCRSACGASRATAAPT